MFLSLIMFCLLNPVCNTFKTFSDHLKMCESNLHDVIHLKNTKKRKIPGNNQYNIIRKRNYNFISP